MERSIFLSQLRVLAIALSLLFLWKYFPFPSREDASLGLLLEDQTRLINSRQSTVTDFEYFRNHIVLSVYLANKGPYKFFLDTGIYPSLLSPQTAMEIGLDIGASVGHISGHGNLTIPYSRTHLKDLQVGGLKVKQIEAIIAEQPYLNKEDHTFHGILGHSFLENLITQIDFKKQKITFHHTLPVGFLKGKADGKDYIQFPLVLAGGKIPLIKPSINGKEITAWLDTGFGRCLALTKHTASTLGLHALIDKGEDIPSMGARGKIEFKFGYVDGMDLQGFRRDSVPTHIFKQRGHNLVGNVFFENYILTLDYLNKQVYLEPN